MSKLYSNATSVPELTVDSNSYVVTCLDTKTTDRAKLQELLGLLSPDNIPPSRDAIEQVLDDPNVTVYGCLLSPGDELVGTITLARYSSFGGVRGWLEDLLVHPSHRGKGLGRALMEHAVRAAQETGLSKLSSTVHPRRKESNNIHIRLGFDLSESNTYKMKF